MLSLSTFTHFAFGANLLAQIPLLNASPLLQQRETGSLDSFTATELPIALQGILNNIGPAGVLVPGAAPGLVIASPTQNNPDCTYYHSAASSLFELVFFAKFNIPCIFAWVSSQFILCSLYTSCFYSIAPRGYQLCCQLYKDHETHTEAKGVGAHPLIHSTYSFHILFCLLLLTLSITA